MRKVVLFQPCSLLLENQECCRARVRQLFRNVPTYGPITVVLVTYEQCVPVMHTLDHRSITWDGNKVATRFGKQHRRRATHPAPPVFSRLILTFRAGNNTSFPPVFTPRDRKNENSLVPHPRTGPPNLHILDNTVKTGPHRRSTLLFTVIPGLCWTIGFYRGFHTFLAGISGNNGE